LRNHLAHAEAPWGQLAASGAIAGDTYAHNYRGTIATHFLELLKLSAK
jgi:hypothetical protein